MAERDWLHDDHELEQRRRSLAMLRPGTRIWTREQACEALEEIQRLRAGMQELLDERRRGAQPSVASPTPVPRPRPRQR